MNPAIRWYEINVEALNSSLDISDFHCSNSDLNDFIKNDALREQRCLLSRTYLFSYEGIVVGLVTLSADSVAAPYLKSVDVVKRRSKESPAYRFLPCVLIGRLAVAEECERKGFGTHILKWAVGLVTSIICESVGCRYLTVDPKPGSLDLYLKSGLGFTLMEAPKVSEKVTRYYINLYKLMNE
ncbi:MAG: GNAT family N-acetyltransferase [Methanothrix sp.]|nr:GNAT family N-acetyltransferase [Methanothrix sp.]